MTTTLICVNSLKCCSTCRHDMPRKKKTTESSEAGCATETPAASHHILQSHMKQATLQFTVMSSDKKTPTTTSTSTLSKADTQQLLSSISPDMLHKALRSFHQCPSTTTLLVTNQSSPIVSLSRISASEQGTVKLSSALPSGVVPDGESGRKLPPPPNSSSPKEPGEQPMTISDSGFNPEPDKLSQESRAPSVSPVAKVDSHSKQHHQISFDHSDDNQQLEGPKHLSPAKTHQWDGSPGFEPPSVTGHDPITLTSSTGGTNIHNPKDTRSQVDSVHGSKKRSSSSESGHETSVVDSMKKKKKKKKHKTKSAGRSLAPRFISFSMCQPPSSMVKDYSWILTDAADGIRLSLLMNLKKMTKILSRTEFWEIPLQVLVMWWLAHMITAMLHLLARQGMEMMVVARMVVCATWFSLWKE